MRLEYRTDGSQKFWEPMLRKKTLTVNFGKIGTSGQTHTKKFTSSEKAQNEYRKLIREKLAKGYKPTSETVVELLRDVTPVGTPAAIGSLFIGEHVPDEVVQDICGWATVCIQHGMTPKHFESIWSKFMEEDGGLAEALGRTEVNVGTATIEEFWLDVTEWCEGELHELYAEAVKSGGDRFIWFDNNAFIDIVALRGDPGARAIELCVLREENCKNKEGQWFNNWPYELGPGAPIASMTCDSAEMRNGKVVRV